MHILYIRKRSFLKTLIITFAIIISIIYNKYLKIETLGVLLNNDKIMPIYSVAVSDKKIALTFDLAWGDEYVQDILNILKRYKIKATFFITGTWVDRYPEYVKQINEEGYEIGNHSLSHVKMTDLVKDKVIREIKDTESKILKITRYKTKVIRFPFGKYDDSLMSTIKEINYKAIQWDVDSLDWEGAREEEIYNRITSKTSNGSIILFHNNTFNMVNTLPNIIEKLRNDGYKFTNISDMLLTENYYIDNYGRQRSLR